MFDELNYAAAVAKVVALFEKVNRTYIEKIAEQIKKIGELNATSIHRLVIFREMSANIAEIKGQLTRATGLGVKGMMQIFQKALDDTYTDPRFADFVKGDSIPQSTNARVNQYVEAVSRQTAGDIINLSNTTAIDTSYHDAIDKAVAAVSSGVTDYQSATRDILKTTGNGIQVDYESGYHRRIDTAVRQNVTNATKQIAQQSSIMMGEDLGFDAYEISAHLRSAPDHEPVQGRVFLKSEFEKMQAGFDFFDVDGNRYQGFRRPVGEWNCMHFISPFSTQHSVRRFTDKQLSDFAEANHKGCEINGKHYTVYEASQLMRQIETDIRRQKDTAIAAQKAGDDVLRQECQRKINTLSARYGAVAKAAGIREDRQRMTVDGFKAVRVKNTDTQTAQDAKQ